MTIGTLWQLQTVCHEKYEPQHKGRNDGSFGACSGRRDYMECRVCKANPAEGPVWRGGWSIDSGAAPLQGGDDMPANLWGDQRIGLLA